MSLTRIRFVGCKKVWPYHWLTSRVLHIRHFGCSTMLCCLGTSVSFHHGFSHLHVVGLGNQIKIMSPHQATCKWPIILHRWTWTCRGEGVDTGSIIYPNTASQPDRSHVAPTVQDKLHWWCRSMVTDWQLLHLTQLGNQIEIMSSPLRHM